MKGRYQTEEGINTVDIRQESSFEKAYGLNTNKALDI